MTNAASHLQESTDKPPSHWTSGDLLGEFPDRSLLSSTITAHYRTGLFGLKRRSHLVVGLGRMRRRGIGLKVRADLEGLTEEQKQGILENVREILLARLGSISSERPSVLSKDSDGMVLRIPGTTDVDLARSLVEMRGIRDQVSVRGFSEREARSLALVLKTGSLPVRLEVVSQQLLK